MKYGLLLSVSILVVSQLACSAANTAQPAPGKGDLLNAEVHQSLSTWFAESPDTRGAVPESCQKAVAISVGQTQAVQDAVWEAYKKGAVALGWESDLPPMFPTLEEVIKMPPKERPKISPSKIESGNKKMPFFMLAKGQRGENGWPAYISLHGGGRCPQPKKMQNPHGWSVNSREWQTQVKLFQAVFEPSGIYFLPRMADDRDGRWWYGYCQDIYDSLIRRLILFYDVDPNRIYLMGISEGGYGAYKLAPFMGDRFAGVGAMAAGAQTAAENLRNLPFRTDVGANDTMFKRITFAREFHQKLDKLKRADSDGYVNHLEAYSNRGHGIEYGNSPKWLSQYTRTPYPDKIVWKATGLHKRHRQQMYWLGYQKNPEKGAFHFTAEIDRETNTVNITAKHEVTEQSKEKGKNGKPKKETAVSPLKDNVIDIFLNDTLLDLDKPVTVVINGRQVFKKKVPRTLESMMQTLDQRGDPCYIFPARIQLEV